MVEIKKYTPEAEKLWDEFITNSKNGTFHQKRAFINYHKNRFEDFSLLIYFKGKLEAIVPAAKVDNNFVSHPGLTYGGIIVKTGLFLTKYLEIFSALIAFLRKESFKDLVLKAIPESYGKFPNGELEYAMFLSGAQIVKSDVLPHVNLNQPFGYQERRKRSIKAAKKLDLEVKVDFDLGVFWTPLNDLLAGYGAQPVHSLEEITTLKSGFPKEIYTVGAFLGNKFLAGVLIFDCNTVVRTQYIVATSKGKEIGALDYLLDYLIKVQFKNRQFLDFGTTTLEGGKNLNKGLSDQKEGFGARTIVQRAYKLDVQTELSLLKENL